MKNKGIIIGLIIGIVMAILWSIVFVNVLNSMAGIGIGICFGISFVPAFSLIFSKKDDEKQNYVEYQEKGNTKKMWIEDLDSIKEKVSLVSNKKLGGVASWAKDREDPGVWEIIKEAIK